jgi:hypothetical protein
MMNFSSLPSDTLEGDLETEGQWGEARALDDAKLPEPQNQARSLAEPCPGQPPADSFWIPSFTILRFLLDLFTCCYGCFGVFLAHSPAFEVSCNKATQRTGLHKIN